MGYSDYDHVKVKMLEVCPPMEEPYFSWKGETNADGTFYDRIQSPVILIEFNRQGLIALDRPRGTPTCRLVHAK